MEEILKHAKEELRRIGFDNHPFGIAVLKYIEECYTLCDYNELMRNQLNTFIPTLMDKRVLSPITEDDFKVINVDDGSGNIVQISQCTRYEHLYKEADGKYYDNRAVAFLDKNPMNGKMYMYNGGNSSRREVELPYMPQEEIVYID